MALTVWNEENYQTRGLMLMAKRVSELTKGDLSLRVEYGGSLGYKGAELLNAVNDGQLDIAEMVTSNVAGDAPVLALRTLPMMVDSWQEVELFDKLAKPYYEKVLDRKNQKLLLISPWPFGGLWSKKKVTDIKDMQGLKIRSYDRNGALFAAACKAQALNVPYAETYTGLATGLIDSTITSSISVREGKFYEVCKFHMPIRFSTASSITTINRKVWDKLAPDQQKALMTAAAECENFLRDEVKKVVAENDDFCYHNGVTKVDVSGTYHNQLVAAAGTVANDWLESNKKAADAIELYNKFMTEKKKLK
ncbi:TRAP transporter substrate-binding protein [Synergistes jonesii]|uniref:TRAP transporter substrate-binding protein n=1 Tax=Synergistes jonesii TaxID=2754 RepID=UPI00248F0403|nr:TRAP transporter substrate-binding protein [Synergistes jonesii]